MSRLVKFVERLANVTKPTESSMIKYRYGAEKFVDKVTHTGQCYEPDDYRLVRFVDKTKEVNENWAIKLIDEVPPAPSKDHIVACNGGGGPLGHPKVYINLDKPGNHTCGYCGLRFYKEGHHH